MNILDSGLQTVNSNNQIKHIPCVYKAIDFNDSDIIVDYGCGRYFDIMVKPFVDKLGLNVLPYDKYARTEEQNNATLTALDDSKATIVLLSNVLNVVEPLEERLCILKNCYNMLAPGGLLYVKIFEGNRTGITSYCEKNKSNQLNRKTNTFIPEIEKFFTYISTKRMIMKFKKEI